MQAYNENNAGENIWKYKYDKAGNKIEVTEISRGKSYTRKYEYD